MGVHLVDDARADRYIVKDGEAHTAVGGAFDVVGEPVCAED